MLGREVEREQQEAGLVGRKSLSHVSFWQIKLRKEVCCESILSLILSKLNVSKLLHSKLLRQERKRFSVLNALLLPMLVVS